MITGPRTEFKILKKDIYTYFLKKKNYKKYYIDCYFAKKKMEILYQTSIYFNKCTRNIAEPSCD